MASDTKAVEFNYKKDHIMADGRILVEPNYGQGGPINRALVIARNSEIPELLKVPGCLTKLEDESIGYRCLKPHEIVIMGTILNHASAFCFLDEASLKKVPKSHTPMLEARKMALCRDEKQPRESKLEMILGCGRRATPRIYTLGFSVNPQHDAAGTAAMNKSMLEPANKEYVIRFLRYITAAMVASVEAAMPKEELDMLKKQAAIDVPFTFGDAENYLFSSLQLNYSDFDESLENGIGKFGSLHVDANDSSTRWTALFNLSNYRKGSDSGRSIFTAIRKYFQQEPKSVCLMKGAQPHISTRPTRMPAESTRRPYQSVPDSELEELDPTKYITSRLMAVGYPKGAIMDKSPVIARTKVPALFEHTEGCSEPEKLPEALLAFGTEQNQWEWHAMAFARARALLVAKVPDTPSLSAQEISDIFRYKAADGTVAKPSPERIQETLDGNSTSATAEAHREKYAEYAKLCDWVLSMKWFPPLHSKSGPISWVKASEIGSTFSQMDPQVQTPMTAYKAGQGNVRASKAAKEGRFSRNGILVNYGYRPYRCRHCESRFTKVMGCRKHTETKHPEFEWEEPEPSVDPQQTGKPSKTLRGKRKVEVDVGEENEAIAEGGEEAGDEDAAEDVEEDAEGDISALPSRKRSRQG